MSSRTSSRPRRLVRLVTIAVAGALVLGAAPAAIAFATDAQRPARVATASPVVTRQAEAAAVSVAAKPVVRRTTAVHDWGATARTVVAGKSLRVHLRVSGGTRAVRLERRLHGRWVVVGHGTASATGRITLHWKAPRTGTRAVLRLHVLHTASYRAALTSQRVVAVRIAGAAPKPTTSSPAPTTAPSPSAEEALRAQLLTLVNQARSSARTCGDTRYPAAPALHRSAPLDTAAGDYATLMATKDFFSHVGPDGSTMVSRLKAVGVTNTTERENIAAGQTTAASVTTSWLASPGHCANLMAADVTRIGFGHATSSGSTYGQYWVQDFAG